MEISINMVSSTFIHTNTYFAVIFALKTSIVYKDSEIDDMRFIANANFIIICYFSIHVQGVTTHPRKWKCTVHKF